MSTINQNLTFLIADDHLIIRQGIQLLIEDLYPNAQITHASSCSQILETLKHHTVSVLILDVQFQDGFSTVIIPEIKKIQPEIKILIFTSLEEEHHSLKVINEGANGFLSKLSEEEEIKQAIQKIVDHGFFYTNFTQKLMALSKINPSIIQPLEQLSTRELQIARLYAKGYENLEISNLLSLKQNTISTFKKRIFSKLSIHSIVELTEIIKVHDNGYHL